MSECQLLSHQPCYRRGAQIQGTGIRLIEAPLSRKAATFTMVMLNI
jgi:hypothetical protein